MMRRVFKFEKGKYTEWNEEMYRWLEGYLTIPGEGAFPRFRKDWKVTITVEEVKKK